MNRNLDYNSMQLLKRLQTQLQQALERQNVAWMGDVTVVRIPDIPGRIRKIPRGKEGDFSVEYISQQWYDEKAGQSRNEKHIIGLILSDYPMAMIPNENYEKFFDMATGRPKESESREAARKPGQRAAFTRSHPDRQKPSGSGEHRQTKEHSEQEAQQEKADKEEQYDITMQEILDNVRLMREKFRRDQQERKEHEEQRQRDLELYGEEESGDIEAIRARQRLEAILAKYEHEDQDMHTNTQQEAGKENKPQTEDEELQATYSAYSYAKERKAILSHILAEILSSIRLQARKRPDDIVNEYKVTRINTILREIIDRYQDTGYEDLLELIDPPREEVKDNQTIRTGLTYSDLEVLLDHYSTILHFIRTDKQKEK